MRLIVEDTTYSIEDIIKAINEELGFSYIKSNDHEGYINFGKGIKLVLKFNEDSLNLVSANLIFPRLSIDLTDEQTMVELYATSIESAGEVVDIIDRMIGGTYEDIE